jgi:hypothetical protein
MDILQWYNLVTRIRSLTSKQLLTCEICIKMKYALKKSTQKANFQNSNILSSETIRMNIFKLV